MSDMTREQKLALIYRHTHKDFKGRMNGERNILVLRAGGTTLIPLSALTDAEIAAKFPYARSKEMDRLAAKATS